MRRSEKLIRIKLAEKKAEADRAYQRMDVKVESQEFRQAHFDYIHSSGYVAALQWVLDE